MAEPLKYIYNQTFFDLFTKALSEVLTDFEPSSFMDMVCGGDWPDLELKARMHKITCCLNKVLPDDFKAALSVIDAIIVSLRDAGCREQGFEYMFLPDYVENYGMDDPEQSLLALRRITMFVSGEFAVRPFIDRYPEVSLNFMMTCAKDPNHHIRRFASEGCRPLLPWSMVLQDLKRDPSPIFPILELLMEDESEYVRRSVANNLNDISKNHPETVLAFCESWIGLKQETNKLIKHGLRTLLKAGDTRALTLFGLGPDQSLKVSAFSIADEKVKMGKALHMSFTIQNTSREDKIVRIEYAMYFLRKNGTYSKKVFKISERPLKIQETLQIEKHHIFRNITTRTYYSGLHRCSVIINGTESEPLDFVLEV